MHLINEIPLWIKISYSAFMCFLIPVYWREYSVKNFLWFSDITLFMMLITLWFPSNLLNSMMALWFFPFAFLWNLDFWARIFLRFHPLNITNYMFKKNIPFYIRALSLFHIFLPALLIWLLIRFHYNPNAFFTSTVLTWFLLPITYLVLSPNDENINWVRGFGNKPQKIIPPLVYLSLLMLSVPILVYLPMHFLCLWLF